LPLLDYTVLDPLGPAIFFPRPDASPPPAGAHDWSLPVAPGVELGVRFHPHDSPDAPCIALFHGNGEVAGDYDEIAADYHGAGAALAVIDFRGYGRSGGRPSFSSMIADACAAFPLLRAKLRELGRTGPWIAMGRSLGTYCALELTAAFPDELCGLVIESGSGELARLVPLAGLDPREPRTRALIEGHEALLRAIELPLLVIHGERDQMIPLSHARALLERVGSRSKHLEVIPIAGHNDLWWLGRARYFAALAEFIRGVAGPASSASR